jgi:hypothetical protein
MVGAWLVGSNILFSQDGLMDLAPIDTIYDTNIKSVQFYGSKIEDQQAFLVRNTPDILHVKFDNLVARPRDLYYSVFHYDQHWQNDDMRPDEFISGFQESRITEYSSSRRTRIPYIHYRFSLTAKNFLISGNYLLLVSDESRAVLFTKRFYVADNNILVSVKFKDPVNASIYRSHQALEVTINTNKKKISNNGKELALHILQNGDPNTIQIKTIPNIYGELIYFNKTDDILFKAMNEYRHKDIRTLESVTQDIKFWDDQTDYYHCWLSEDDNRLYKSYFTETDLNGEYLILNRERPDPDTESEYVMAHFTLRNREELAEPVYLYGSFSQWKLSPAYKMEYDPGRKAYFGTSLIKLGYYNFMYAVADENQKPDTSPLEGDWYETENDYQVFVYYRPFGSRYDQLLFAGEFNSNR